MDQSEFSSLVFMVKEATESNPGQSACTGLNRKQVDCTFQQLAGNRSDGVSLVKGLLQAREQAIALYRRESAKTFVDVPRRVVELREIGFRSRMSSISR